MKKLLILLAIISPIFPQDYFDWRLSKEPIDFNINASVTHIVGSAYLAEFFNHNMPWWQADLTALSIGVLWEIKDGLVPWEHAGYFGGEGFSTNDLKMDIGGILINRLGLFLWDKYKNGELDLHPEFSFNIKSLPYPMLTVAMEL